MKTAETRVEERAEGLASKEYARAFTLIEMLVVTLIMGVVVAAVAACLSGGIRAWDSVQKFNEYELNVLPPLEMMERELKNSFDHYSLPFSGSDSELSFAVLLSSDTEEFIGERIGTVKFFYDPGQSAVFRKEWVYPDEEPDSAEKMIAGVAGVSFRYFYLGEDDGPSAFKVDGTNILTGVQLVVECGERERARQIVRSIALPVPRLIVAESAGGLR